MFKAFKLRIYPTKEQIVLLEKHFGACRWLYNKSLELKSKTYSEEKKNLGRFEIQKLLPEWKVGDFQWLSEVNAQSLQNSIFNLDKAFSNFFKKKSKFPTFKNKFGRNSFGIPQRTKVDFEKNRVFIPKFTEGIKTAFSRQFEGTICSSTVIRSATGKYFISILVELDKVKPEILPVSEETCLGIDLGVKDFATFSNGEKVENLRILKKKLKKLKRVSRQHSKKKKGSKNREKSRKKLAIVHERVSSSRLDFQHKLTTKIAENQSYSSVSMETLSIEGMLKNKKLARHISDAAWFQFKTLLKYKLEDRGKTLLEIGRFEPSSKMCSCGAINHSLSLKDRLWTCSECNCTHDRDVLAANNIKKFAFLGPGRPEFTPPEIRVSGSLKEECQGFLN